MNKNLDLLELTTIIAKRSTCNVQVGAVIYDVHLRILSWGWNHAGSNGRGEHAESFALSRGNRSRFEGATIITVAIRRGKRICSLPCIGCAKKITRAKLAYVNAQDVDGFRRTFKV